MKYQALLCTIVLCATSVVAVAQDAPAVTARVVGVRVIVTDFPTDQFNIPPFNGQPGTAVALLLSSSDKSIVDVVVDASKIDRFTDDQGGDLLKELPKAESNRFFMQPQVIGGFPKISEDAKHAVVEINGPSAPAAGATQLQLNGTITLRLASGTKAVTVEGVTLAPGKLEVPGYAIDIKEISEEDWGNGPQPAITFKLTGAAAQGLADIAFRKADGSELKSNRTMSMTMFSETQITYMLEEKVDTATIEFIFWDGLETVEVSLDYQIPLGL